MQHRIHKETLITEGHIEIGNLKKTLTLYGNFYE